MVEIKKAAYREQYAAFFKLGYNININACSHNEVVRATNIYLYL